MCQRALNQCICIFNVNFEDSKEKKKKKKRGDRLVIIFCFFPLDMTTALFAVFSALKPTR